VPTADFSYELLVHLLSLANFLNLFFYVFKNYTGAQLHIDRHVLKAGAKLL